jgi:glycosyltransferase involved in cell wall biosynthesis
MNDESDPAELVVDRLRRIEQEWSLSRRELLHLQDQLADLESHIDALKPLLRIWGIGRSILRLFAIIAGLPADSIRMLAGIPAVAQRLKEAKLRSKRLVKDASTGEWNSKFDLRAYLWHARRAAGVSRQTIYRIDPRQRPSITHRPRILHVIPNVWVGGSTQLVVDLHDYLGHRFDMEVVTSALPAKGRIEGMKISALPRPPSRHEARHIFLRYRPHVTHVHFWGDVDTPWYRPFFEMAAELSCPIVQNINTPVAPFTEVPVARNVFVSQAMLDEFGSLSGAQVIHPGINLGMFSPQRTSDVDAYDAIGMVYRLERDKLNESSIEPFIMVVKRRPQTRAIIIGDGSLFQHFQSRVRQEGLMNRFEFTGYVPYEDLPAHYARFKIFVAPVWQESFGQVIPFAMSMGLAVAGNRVGAIPEILGDASSLGATPEETVTRILTLLEDRDKIDTVGATNRSIASTNFSVEGMAIAYADVYKSMIPMEAELMPDYPAAVDFPL